MRKGGYRLAAPLATGETDSIEPETEFEMDLDDIEKEIARMQAELGEDV